MSYNRPMAVLMVILLICTTIGILKFPCQVSSTPLELVEIVTGEGSNLDNRFGWNVSHAGDVNGDGYDDLIVGAPFNDSTGTNAGAAYIFFGYAEIDEYDLNASNANVTLYGESAGDLFGWDVAGGGDINGDGYDDIVVGAPGADKAYVYYGPPRNNTWKQTTQSDFDAGTKAHVVTQAVGDGEVKLASFNDIKAMAAFYDGAGGVVNTRYRTWNQTEWSAEATANPGGDINRWYVLKSGTTRKNEKILGVADEGIDINVQVWDGTSWNPVTELVDSSANTAYRHFDIAYESLSGDALIVYFNASSGDTMPKYKVWDGTTWSAEQNALDSGTGADIYWVVLASDPNSDEILLATLDSGADIYAQVWDGDSWGNLQTLELDAVTITYPCLDIAYEHNSGDGLVVYADAAAATIPRYWTWSGGSWSGEFSANTVGEAIRFVELASDPTSNRILLGTLDSGADINLQIWDGSAFGTNFEATAAAKKSDKRCYDIAWESFSGKAMVAYGIGQDAPVYRTWTSAGGWTGQANALDPLTGSGNDPEWVDVASDRQTNNIMLMHIVDDGPGAQDDIGLQIWDGSSWGNGAELETNSDKDKNLCFDVIYTDTSGYLISSPIDAGSTVSWNRIYWSADTPIGTYVKFRTRTASTEAGLGTASWSDWYTVSGSSITSPDNRWIQYQAWLNTTDITLTPTLEDVTVSIKANVTISGTLGSDFGSAVAIADGVNGDSYADVLVGAPSFDSNKGLARIYYGGDPMNNILDVNLTGTASGDKFGFSVASAGDVNDGGLDDVLIGAPGADRAYVYYAEEETAYALSEPTGTWEDKIGVYTNTTTLGVGSQNFTELPGSPSNEWTYVTTNTDTTGITTNFANAQSSTDGGLYATLREENTESTYNFVGITPPSSTHIAWYDLNSGDFDVNANPPSAETGEFDQTRYDGAEADDSAWAEAFANTARHHRFRFVIDELIPDIVQIYIYWKGHETNGEQVTLYIWNINLGSWEALEVGTGTSDFVLEHTISTSISSYIDSNNYLYIVIFAPVPTGSDYLSTNYIKVDITTAYKMNIEFNTIDVLAGSEYYLELNYNVIDENFGVLVYNYSSLGWDDLSWQGDLTSVTMTTKTYSLNASHRSATGTVRVRYVGRTEIGDTSNSTLNIEYHRIRTYHSPMQNLTVTYTFDFNIVPGGRINVSIRAFYDDPAGEGMSILSWNYSSSAFEDTGLDVYAGATYSWTNFTLDNYFVSSTGEVKLRYENDTSAYDELQGMLSIDYQSIWFVPWVTPSVTLAGPVVSSQFGFAVASAGNFTGSQYDAIIVGAPYTANGSAYIYFGNNPMDALPDINITGSCANDRFGYTVASAGYINLDTFGDIVIGAPYNDSADGNIEDAGAVFVFCGTATAYPEWTPETNASYYKYGASASELFGYTVSYGGDPDINELNNTFVGAPGFDAGKVYLFEPLLYTVDYIRIVDTPDSGITEIVDQTVPVGFTITGYGAAYNLTYGYIGDTPVSWSVTNGAGASASTSPLLGISSEFNAGITAGWANWTASDGAGHLDYVNFTISPPSTDYIVITASPGGVPLPDSTIAVGFTVTGYASSYNTTAGYIGLIEVEWTITNGGGATATTLPAVGTSSEFNAGLNGGWSNWTATNITLGISDYVNFTITPATPDWINITASPGGSAILDLAVPVGYSITGYASAYNATAGYIGLIEVEWTVTNGAGATASTSPLLGTSSEFNAGLSAGWSNWTATNLTLGMSDYVNFTIIPPTIDYIKITDVPNGVELSDTAVNVGFTIVGYASGYNYTVGYMNLVSVTWSVTNGAGATASTSPTTGTSSEFSAGSTSGWANWTANDGAGHLDYVNFTINPPGIDAIAIRDSPGATANNVTGATVPVGFSATYYAASFNTTVGYIEDIAPTWSFEGTSGGSADTGILSSSTYVAGLSGGTDYLNISYSGKFASAVFTVLSPTNDTIEIRDAPGGNANNVTDQPVLVGYSTTLYAAVFNLTAGYLADISPDWSYEGTSGGGIVPTGVAPSTTYTAGGTSGMDYVNISFNGMTDSVKFSVNLYAVDSIEIRDAPGATANNITAIVNVPVGYTAIYYAASFNATIGYIEDIEPEWSFEGTSGGTADTGTLSNSTYTAGLSAGVDYLNITYSGFDDSVKFDIMPPTIDWITIRNAPGSGGNDVVDMDVPVGFSATYYSAAFNITAGYLYDIAPTWSFEGTSGGSADIGTLWSSTYIAGLSAGVDYLNISYDGEFYSVKFNVTAPTVDYILITDAPNGTGNAIPDQSIVIEWELTGYASAFNITSGYIADIIVSWSVTNTGGATATTSPTVGSSSTFNSGTTSGNATWTATDAVGHTDTVEFNITSYQPDYMVIRTAPEGEGELAGDYEMTTDDTWTLWAALYNNSGTPSDTLDDVFLADVPANWSLSGGIGLLAPTTATISTTLDATTPGTGVITAIYDTFIATTGTITVTVGQLHHIVIEYANGSWVAPVTITTADTIVVYAQGYDADNNVIGYVAVNWWVTEGLDPIPFGPSTNVTFEPSTPYTSGKLAADTSALPGSPDNLTGTISVVLGPLATIKIEYSDGNEVGSLVMIAGESITLYARGYDIDDNLIGELMVVWGVTGGIGTVSNMYATSTIFTAETVGVGTITADNETVPGTPDDTTGLITVNPGSLAYIIIRNGSGGDGSEVTSATVIAGDSLQLWAAGYDAYDNYIADINCDWTTTGTIELQTATDINTFVFSPIIAWTSGTIVATTTATGLEDSTGIITVVPSVLHHFTVDAPPTTVTAGTPFSITITALDAFDNIIRAYNESGAGVDLTVTGTGTLTPTFVGATEFVDGIVTVNVTYYVAETITITATEHDSIEYGVSAPITVLPGLPARVVILDPLDSDIETPVEVIIHVLDDWDNIVTTDSSTTFAVTVNGSATLTLSGRMAISARAGYVEVTVTNGEARVIVADKVAELVVISLIDIADLGFDMSSTQTIFFADTLGPIVMDIVCTPNPTGNVNTVMVTAIATDYYTGNTTIYAVEYFVAIVSENGTGIEMHAVDDGFDTATEDVWVEIDISAWLPGTYVLYIHAMDIAGNWGLFNFTELEVTKIYVTAPTNITPDITYDKTPLIEWSGATTLLPDVPIVYYIQLGTTPNGSEIFSWLEVGTENYYQITTPLPFVTTYWVQLKSVIVTDDPILGTIVSDVYQELLEVCNRPPSAPSSLEPLATYNLTPLLTWKDAIDPDPDDVILYYIKICRTGAGINGDGSSAVIIDWTLVGDTPEYQVTVTLVPGAIYLVQLYATDGYANSSIYDAKLEILSPAYYELMLTATPVKLTLYQGETGTVTINVSNCGTVDDDVRIAVVTPVAQLTDYITLDIINNLLRLAPGETATFTLLLTLPLSFPVGMYNITITAESLASGKIVETTIELTVIQYYSLIIYVSIDELKLQLGKNTTVTITLINNGSGPDIITLSIDSVPSDLVAFVWLDKSMVQLAPSDQIELELMIDLTGADIMVGTYNLTLFGVCADGKTNSSITIRIHVEEAPGVGVRRLPRGELLPFFLWVSLVIVIIVITIVLIAIITARKRRRKRAIEVVEEEVPLPPPPAPVPPEIVEAIPEPERRIEKVEEKEEERITRIEPEPPKLVEEEKAPPIQPEVVLPPKRKVKRKVKPKDKIEAEEKIEEVEEAKEKKEEEVIEGELVWSPPQAPVMEEKPYRPSEITTKVPKRVIDNTRIERMEDEEMAKLKSAEKLRKK